MSLLKYCTTITRDADKPDASAESILYVVFKVACKPVPTNDQSYPVAAAAVAVAAGPAAAGPAAEAKTEFDVILKE